MADNAGNKCYAPRGVGEIIQVEIADPAVATSPIYISPGLASGQKYLSRVLGMRMQLVADANPADRTVVLYTLHPDSGDEINIVVPQTTDVQTAGQTRQWIFQPGMPFHSYFFPSNFIVALPADIWLLPGGTISSSLLNVQVGDQFSNVKLILQRWQVA